MPASEPSEFIAARFGFTKEPPRFVSGRLIDVIEPVQVVRARGMTVRGSGMVITEPQVTIR